MALHPYQKQLYIKVGVIAALIILPIAGFFCGRAVPKANRANRQYKLWPNAHRWPTHDDGWRRRGYG